MGVKIITTEDTEDTEDQAFQKIGFAIPVLRVLCGGALLCC